MSAMLQQRIQEQEEAGQALTPEELDAKVKALDELIAECEATIVGLSDKKDREVKAWFKGALGGLRVARAVWCLWLKSTES